MIYSFHSIVKCIAQIVAVCFVLSSCSSENNNQEETDFCKSIHRNDSISLSSELAEVKHLMDSLTGVYVLEEGSGSMVTRAWLSEYAENTIDIQYFIFSMDNIGLIACDYLVRAADRGVKIRILVDDFMVDADIEDILTFNSHENITVKIYNPGVNLGKNIVSKAKKYITDFRSANQRMHNKTFTVDGKVVITGGRNIADEYFDYDHEYNFRDRDILLLGKATEQVNKSFDRFWDSSFSINVSEILEGEEGMVYPVNRFAKLHEYACNPENFSPHVRKRIENLPEAFSDIQKSGDLVWLKDVVFISDVPGKNNGKSGLGGGGATTSALINLVNNAKSSIDIQTPYLITTELSRKIFKAAVSRGVKIRILTNSLASTDNIEAFSGYQADREKLLATGVKIFEFRPDAEERMSIMNSEIQDELDYTPIFGLHAKSMVIDGETTVVGTFNLDPRSADLNTECIVIVESEQVAKGVLGGMEKEFQPENSWETTFNFNPDSKVDNYKRVKTWSRKLIPKEIL